MGARRSDREKQATAPRRPATIAELVSLASVLLVVPGAIVIALAIVAIANRFVDIGDLVFLPVLLALSTFAVFLVALIGATASGLHLIRTQQFQGLIAVAFSIHVALLGIAWIFWCSGYQLSP